MEINKFDLQSIADSFTVFVDQFPTLSVLDWCSIAAVIAGLLILVKRLGASTDENTGQIEIEAESDEIPHQEIVADPIEIKEEIKEDSLQEEQITPVKEKLQKTRSGFLASLKGIFSSKELISKEDIEELRYTLVSSDIGIRTTDLLIKELTESLDKNQQVTEQFLIDSLKHRIEQDLSFEDDSIIEKITPKQFDHPKVVLIVGVNGVGKTTTTAKLADRLKQKGLSVLLVAADTFRAAAVLQLKTWGERLDIEVISGADEAKPQTVVFDAMQQTKNKHYDVVLIDTAGRLNTKTSLMQELTGVRNAVEKHSEHGVSEVFLVVDGTTGQNAVSQAKEFHEAAVLTGIIVTKLDGTAKGGVVVAVKNEIQVPIRYIGVGESSKDLRKFEVKEFVDALFDGETKELENVSAHAETRKRRRRAA